jgi:Abnormal spindle-like microcephaly-assoc'd, ASPM-SPD-2-Hydin
MSLFPQFACPTLFSLLVGVSTLFALPGLMRAENQSLSKSDSHIHRGQLTCVATTLQLGEVAVGRTSDKLTTITNSGTKPLTVLSAVSTGTEFGLNGLNFPLTLAASESFTFEITFAPQRSGPDYGIISIVSDIADAPKQTLTIRLAGTGTATGQLGITPGMIAFRDVNAGTPRTQIGHLTASTASVTISSANINSKMFQLGGLSLPVTIPAGHSVPFTVTLISQSGGSTSAILSFASDAENSPTEQVVTVRGAVPVRHKVQLSWKASKSKHVVGYNVYRANRAGGPYKKINHSLDPITNYTDRHVVAGCKYYYVARAVNMKGLESKYSKLVQAVIPCGRVITDVDGQREAGTLLTCGVCKY